ncbi:hypothetical protein F5Y19DRAFT_469810 [Xylariaceae sp. FL1651]|nr:hypothetical protein F5Y19DRAFT_469810 [Xylariaceae sp. FL1651]
MQFSPLSLLTAIISTGLLPFLAAAEPIPVALPKDAAAAGFSRRQAFNFCCMSGCMSCMVFGCVDGPCMTLPFSSCCAVRMTRELEDGSIDSYNEDGVKMEFVSFAQ